MTVGALQVAAMAPTTSSGSASQQVATDSSLTAGGSAVVANTGGLGVNVRNAAGLHGTILFAIPEASAVQVTGAAQVAADGASWRPVDVQGTRGWIHGDYLAPAGASPALETVSSVPAASSIGAQIAATAQQYLGVPYVWGGTTAAGFDCSGFTYFVVNQVTGGGSPRAMAAQLARSSAVDPQNLQPGDLLFFQNTYKAGLSHAGIYVGNGQFVNAANASVGVTLGQVWDSYEQ